MWAVNAPEVLTHELNRYSLLYGSENPGPRVIGIVVVSGWLTGVLSK
jgi:hypothetical protein